MLNMESWLPENGKERRFNHSSVSGLERRFSAEDAASDREHEELNRMDDARPMIEALRLRQQREALV
jgi:hypothetical protein